MLTPKYLDNVPDRLIELYAEVEADIIADMCARLSKMDFIPSAEWQYKKLIEMGYVHDYIMERLSEVSGITKKEIEQLMLDSGVKALTADNKIYHKAGLSPPPINASPTLQAVLQAGIDSTNGLFRNLTGTTANTATKQFEDILDRAWLQINSGAFDYNIAIRTAVKDLTSKGIKSVTFPSGHSDYLDVAVRRATVTGVNQTALKLQEELADELGSDLVETSAHSGARPLHAEWQGKVFSRSGTHSKYPDFKKSTGYGTGAGLGGWNCRHSFFPYFEGMEQVYTQAELDEMNVKKYEHNGEKLTEYEASQKQRAIERNIRKYKREYVGMESAEQPTNEASAKLAKWHGVRKDFIKQTGLKRQHDRENVVDWGQKKIIDKPANNKTQYNYSKTPDIFNIDDIPSSTRITPQNIYADMKTSSVGSDTLKYIEESETRPKLDYHPKGGGVRGEEFGGQITLYLNNCKDTKTAACSLIHESAHKRYGIGQSQWAESVCLCQEIMHRRSRDYLTITEKRTIIKAVKDVYPEFNWKKGGIINGRRTK